MAEPRVYILSGPSGAGKTSLAQRLVKTTPGTALSVSHTTRPRRPGERDGIDYFFVEREEFEAMIRAERFLEYAEVFDHLYGTSREAVDRLLAGGCAVVLDIDWQGARQVRRRLQGVCSIFVLPPSLKALERRLRERAQDDAAVIERRMREAVDEMRHHDEYDFLVVNDTYAAALADLRAIVAGQPEQARPPALDVVAELLGGGIRRRHG